VGWEKWDEVIGNANWAFAGAAAAVRDGKCFVQIQMTDICAHDAGVGQSYLRIHVGAVHIYLASVFMNYSTHFYDIGFKNPMSGRISNHQGG